jgi:hypothetical protein
MTQAFNLSQFANKVNTSGQADLTTAVTGTLPVANGGTGAASLTGNSVAITNAGGTALSTVAAGANGNVLTSNGTTWTSAASSGGQFQTQLFTSPGTWTKPASATQVRVTVVGGGGAGGIPGGPGVVNGSPGGTSSFGPAVSATGGAAATSALPAGSGAPGTGTISVGTAIKSGNVGFAAGPGSTSQQSVAFGNISGFINQETQGPSPGIAYSTTSRLMAGARGSNAGLGGIATAISPVSAPVTITVGAGGTSPSPAVIYGIGGAVLVEFVG